MDDLFQEASTGLVKAKTLSQIDDVIDDEFEVPEEID